VDRVVAAILLVMVVATGVAAAIPAQRLVGQFMTTATSKVSRKAAISKMKTHPIFHSLISLLIFLLLLRLILAQLSSRRRGPLRRRSRIGLANGVQQRPQGNLTDYSLLHLRQ
jgi:hypothetical protein